jgi:hypothetical protein
MKELFVDDVVRSFVITALTITIASTAKDFDLNVSETLLLGLEVFGFLLVILLAIELLLRQLRKRSD